MFALFCSGVLCCDCVCDVVLYWCVVCLCVVLFAVCCCVCCCCCCVFGLCVVFALVVAFVIVCFVLLRVGAFLSALFCYLCLVVCWWLCGL